MRIINIFVSFAIFCFAFICTENLYAQQKLRPLSCRTQMIFNGDAALWRDMKGIATKQTSEDLKKLRDGYKYFVINLEGGNEITDEEIEEILDRVYIKEINKTPDEIKDKVYKSCIAKTKEKSAFGKKIPSMIDILTK